MKLLSVAMIAILMTSSCAPPTVWDSYPISGVRNEVASDLLEVNNITYDYGTDMVYSDDYEVMVVTDIRWPDQNLYVNNVEEETSEVISFNNDIVWVDPLSLIDISKLLDLIAVAEFYSAINYKVVYSCSVCHIEPVVRWADKVSVYFLADDFDWAMRVILCESSGREEVVNRRSKSTGLFQHLPKFWEERHVLANDAGYVNDGDMFDPDDNIAVAAWLYYEYGGSRHWNESKHCWK
jgi:hypothetical protein